MVKPVYEIGQTCGNNLSIGLQRDKSTVGGCERPALVKFGIGCSIRAKPRERVATGKDTAVFFYQNIFDIAHGGQLDLPAISKR